MNREQSVPEWVYDAASELYSEMHRIDGEAMDAAQRAQDSEAGEYEWCNGVAKVINGTFREFIEFHSPEYLRKLKERIVVRRSEVTNIETAVAVLNERSHRLSEWFVQGSFVWSRALEDGLTPFEAIAIAEAYLRSENK
jgi:hypothetical protein